ncbi:lytic transglycosylase domain-containing protein [Sphingomonas bacterium]|uniref:lytic transglycosylase domain-containing protein n=1 Tax=Sphingomonas bacterium TaxID=1895847 RepID=UPI001574FBD2|nr:lytic transglycosylase domain-containing protein [Sphingomonas bacterium]
MNVNPITTSRIHSAIASASSATGVDFDYLLGQAKLESGLNASARASTSSATGLYQFIDQSWLSVVKKHGAEHGLSWAADAIQPGANGKLTVADGATKQAILGLRNDPSVASIMAAASASDNGQALQGTLGRAATGTDLYMAHFLGLGGATKFLTTMQANPSASGASLFPNAAAANGNVFYASDGSARSLSDIYSRFAAKLGSAASATGGVPSAGYRYASQALDTGDGATVVTGNGESATTALAWARGMTGQSAAQTNVASLFRPTPDTARLAYMMLASMGA